jgi:NAD(P)-dependent dehydrogenase (short-subunit alcohol dehydrogenase family)
MDYVVTQVEPQRRVVLEGRGGLVHAIDDIRFERIPAGTRIDYTADLSFDGLASLAEPLMGPLLRRVGQRAVKGLRRALSGPPPAPQPSWLTYGLDYLLLPGLLGFTKWGYRMRRACFSPMAESLHGRVVVITGATSGLGRAAAGELARLGARVVLVGRSREKLDVAREEIRAATGNDDLGLQVADLSRLSEVRALADRLLARERRIHVLVHNAGVLENERVETAEGLERSLATNLLAPFVLTRRLAPRLRESAPARVVNVLSGGMYLASLGASVRDDPTAAWDGASAYARHKRALMVLTEAWAEEFGPGGITVHAMHPGWAETPGVVRSLPGFHRITRPWLRTAEEGADTIVWLAAAPEVAQTTGGLWLDRERHPTVVLPWTAPSATDRARLIEELSALTADAARAASAPKGAEPAASRRRSATPRDAVRRTGPASRARKSGHRRAPRAKA